MDDVSQGIFKVIADTFQCDPSLVTRATQSEDIDGWDSLSHTVLLLGIERQFGLRLDDSVFDVADVGGLIDHVAAALASSATPEA